MKHIRQPCERLLVVMPSWIGDSVMATPTLRALRLLYPHAQITALVRAAVRPILDASPWVDRLVTIRPRRRHVPGRRREGPFNLARRLAIRRFDTAVLLPNSFRSALLTRMAGVPRRVGYDRDGRGFLLTDRLLSCRLNGKNTPASPRHDYLGIARYLGAAEPDTRMQLFTRPEHDNAVTRVLRSAGYDPAKRRPLVLITPGVSYGSARQWSPQRFAAVADQCTQQLGAVVAVSGSPKERPLLDRVHQAAQHRVLDLPRLGIDLTGLKSMIRLSSLVITNDTGPRHIAAALNVPVVTVFGPTDPAWNPTDFESERHVRVQVFCGPCQKKHCPLDHRCLFQVNPAMVFAQAADLLNASAEATPTQRRVGVSP